ncbi:VWFA and cache domain-containing protein CG16868 [Aplysia californica]|uniref:VWFA and cache domain-containing protein CG16868 n=1 Tax=Aplysia californica TaxID=6500 RepID=A0ABM1VTR2_APLCA|nr:VWFA and cache domain-containing protein CG16868 [Aplysia californica]
MTGTCSTAGHSAREDKLGIKFSPCVFAEPETYINRQESVQQVEEMNNFIQQPFSPPAAISDDFIDDVMTDLTALNSDFLKGIIENTKITTQRRFIGTLSGILLTSPAVALSNSLDHMQYKWFKAAVKRQDEVLFTRHKFPGPFLDLIVSQAVVGVNKVYGAAAAKVPLAALRSLIFTKVHACSDPKYSCELLDNKGFILDALQTTPGPPPSKLSHVTEVYPWLANVLLRRGALKPKWCAHLASGQLRLTHDLLTPPGGVSSSRMSGSTTDECRMFFLHPVRGSNILLLALATRSSSGCTSENGAPFEDCSLGPRGPPPLGAKPPALRKCKNCPSLGNSTLSNCQPPCFCGIKRDSCSAQMIKPVGNWELEACFDEPQDPMNSVSRPPPPSPGVSACSRTCSEITAEVECKQNKECLWTVSIVYPTCLHIIATTTTTTPATTTVTTTVTTKGGEILVVGRSDPKDQSGSDTVGAAVGGSLSALILLAAVGVAVCLFVFPAWWKRRGKVDDTETAKKQTRFSLKSLFILLKLKANPSEVENQSPELKATSTDTKTRAAGTDTAASNAIMATGTDTTKVNALEVSSSGTCADGPVGFAGSADSACSEKEGAHTILVSTALKESQHLLVPPVKTARKNLH